MNGAEGLSKAVLVTEFARKLEKQNVYMFLSCTKESPVYEDVEECYGQVESLFLEAVAPRALLSFGVVPSELAGKELPAGQEVLFLITTLGKRVSELASSFYNAGDYLSSMMIDAMSDSFLFGMEKEVQDVVRLECAKREYGVEKRLEAPEDLPMLAQKVAYEQSGAAELLNMSITTGLMLDPVKSSCVVMKLSRDKEIFRLQHDCSHCKAPNCALRKKPAAEITVTIENDGRQIRCAAGENLLSALVRQGQKLAAVCGGRGVCGKCKIQLVEGRLSISAEEKRYFSAEELAKGYRLACKAVPDTSCTIRLCFDNEDSFEVLGSYGDTPAPIESDTKDNSYVIGVDIGTTTIAMQLLGAQSRTVLGSYTTINHQRRFGADVISRIEASNQGKGADLQKSVREDLLAGFQKLTGDAGIPAERLERIGISGNTTMIHLLMGYDCHSLGVSPFTPVNIQTIEAGFAEIFDSPLFPQANVMIFPGISTYVGGDIVAGLYYCGFDHKDQVSVFLDLGTNGEIAVGNSRSILSTATAAGPAFEGGNVSHGVGSIAGAICGVTLKAADQVEVKTIGNQPPAGICGTGIIELMSQLLKWELVDETGRMDEDYDDSFPVARTIDGEEINFTQKDVREIQLAKSAVRAGMETLLVKYGVDYDAIGKIYVAGGFGNKMNVDCAVTIGLLPEELRNKFESVGNSALGGVIESLFDCQSAERIARIIALAKEINLGSDPVFNDQYMEHMMFPYEE